MRRDIGDYEILEIWRISFLGIRTVSFLLDVFVTKFIKAYI